MITLTNEMREAMNLIATTNKPLYITGKAGTGKTTFLRHVVNAIDKKFIITAPTGVAAINAGGVTLHSLLSIPFGVLDPSSAIKSGFSDDKRALLNAIDVLIIDEVSMVRPDVVDYIDRKLQIYRDDAQPFGGVQILMFGDLFQLPPVVIGEEKDALSNFYHGPYFFYAHAFRNCGFKVVELNRIFRQSDPRFIDILNNIRSYKITDADIEDLAGLRDKKTSGEYSSHQIHICSYKKDVQKINDQMLGDPSHVFHAQISDGFNINAAPCDAQLKLRVGARVMMLINDKYKSFCNGSLGVVSNINEHSVKVSLDKGFTVEVGRNEWQSTNYTLKDGKIVSSVRGTCRQFPLTLAWAITIHKSQGLTFDQISIHTKGVFCPGQIYVALSRCTSLEGIVSDTFIDRKHILFDCGLQRFEAAYKANNYFFDMHTYKLMR